MTAAATAVRRAGSWSSWGRERRRLVVLTVVNWIAAGVLAAIGILLGDARIVLLGVPLLVVDWWISSKLIDAEHADGALADIADAPTTPEEQELLDDLDAAGGSREADLLLVRRWLAGDEVLKRYRYPTRELLAARSCSEAVEVLGLAIVALTAPAVVPVAIGGLLWLLGGRAGANVARAVLGDRLYRTPIDDAGRERWLLIEQRLIVAVGVPVVALAVLRLLS